MPSVSVLAVWSWLNDFWHWADWVPIAAIASALAALATVFLGVGTYKMAKATRDGADATGDLVRSSSEQLELLREQAERDRLTELRRQRAQAQLVSVEARPLWNSRDNGFEFPVIVRNAGTQPVYAGMLTVKNWSNVIPVEISRVDGGYEQPWALQCVCAIEERPSPTFLPRVEFRFRDLEQRVWSQFSDGLPLEEHAFPPS
jgi:hypothetical protein